VPALVAGAPPGQPAHHLVVVDDQLEHHVEQSGHQVEQLVEHLGLPDGAGKAVQQEAGARVILAEPVLDHRDRDLVGDEVTGVHVLAGLQTEIGALAHVGPEDLAGGDFRDHEMRGDELSLGALPSAWRPHQYEPH
jgi:hypothetical protein